MSEMDIQLLCNTATAALGWTLLLTTTEGRGRMINVAVALIMWGLEAYYVFALVFGK